MVSRCTESESGGRGMIDSILTNTMLPDISREFLTRMMEAQPIQQVEAGLRTNNLPISSTKPTFSKRCQS